MSYSFKEFIGIVAETDSSGLRARVRVFGIHNMEDNVNVSDGDLPWAVISYPVDSTSMHTLKRGTWVIGFFVDGLDAQQPVITGQFGKGQSGPLNGSDRFSGRRVYDTTIDGSDQVEGGVPMGTTTATINIPGGSNLEKAYNYIYNKLVQNNLSTNPRMHTAAFVGVLMTETYNGDLRPGITNSIGAFGICQWLGSRRSDLFQRYGRSTDLANQLDFMWWELNNTENRARRAWLGASNLEDATAGAASFERNEAWSSQGYIIRSHPIFQRTYRYAQQVFNTMSPEAYNQSSTPTNPNNQPQGT